MPPCLPCVVNDSNRRPRISSETPGPSSENVRIRLPSVVAVDLERHTPPRSPIASAALRARLWKTRCIFLFVEVRDAAIVERELEANPPLGELGLELLGEVLEERVQVDAANQDPALALRERERLAHHGLEELDLAPNGPCGLPAGVLVFLLHQHLRVTRNDRQRRLEIVQHARQEPAERREPLLASLLCARLGLGDRGRRGGPRSPSPS